jgi:hypothetical protein
MEVVIHHVIGKQSVIQNIAPYWYRFTQGIGHSYSFLLSASGTPIAAIMANVLIDGGFLLFPRRVLSTTMHPPLSTITSSTPRFSLRKLNPHSPKCPSVLFQYALTLFFPGGIYQLPHLSFAISGNPYASATDETKVASSEIDWRRFVSDSELLWRA